MRIIQPLSINNTNLFKEIIYSKHNPTRDRLLSCLESIVSDYGEYDRNHDNLEQMVPDRVICDYREDLWKCYESGQRVSQIKCDIKNNVPDEIKGKCLYCMISEPNTLDHYLDKSEFPEFSVYTDNLIPCCSYCNNLKGTRWIEAGKRIIVNSYYDEEPDERYLYISVGMSSGEHANPYIVDVRCNFDSVSACNKQIDIIKSHYKKLKLIDRYKDQAVGYLANIVYEMTEQPRLSRQGVIETLNRRIHSLIRNNGNNFWETAVCYGILDNQDVIEWLSLD